jgi:hypothetical protein
MSDLEIGICTYCGKSGPTTYDHVPPKNLFPKPRPSNLRTVPSCLSCNQGASDDDEYFRLMLAMSNDLAGNPHLDKVRPIALGALERPEHARLKRAIELTRSKIVLFSPTGDVAGHQETYAANTTRLDNVVSRTAAGWYFIIFGQRAEPEMMVGSQLESEVRFNNEPLLLDTRDLLASQPPRVSYPGIYEARILVDTDNRAESFWWHTFYDNLNFISAIMPKRFWSE